MGGFTTCPRTSLAWISRTRSSSHVCVAWSSLAVVLHTQASDVSQQWLHVGAARGMGTHLWVSCSRLSMCTSSRCLANCLHSMSITCHTAALRHVVPGAHPCSQCTHLVLLAGEVRLPRELHIRVTEQHGHRLKLRQLRDQPLGTLCRRLHRSSRLCHLRFDACGPFTAPQQRQETA